MYDLEESSAQYEELDFQRQYEGAGGLFWRDVKAFEKRLLLNLANKCKTLIVTAHLRNAWQGNRPTNKRERKGKETLMELADLELVLERKPNQAVPSARVVKCVCVSEPGGPGRYPLGPAPLPPSSHLEGHPRTLRRSGPNGMT